MRVIQLVGLVFVCGEHIHVPSSEALDDRSEDVVVGVETERHQFGLRSFSTMSGWPISSRRRSTHLIRRSISSSISSLWAS